MKKFQISALGLKNIIIDINQPEEEFIFEFGDRKIQMNRFFAEFISPRVSHIHQTDPTIKSINFDYFYKSNPDQIDFLNQTVLDKFEQLSRGKEILLDEKDSYQLQLLCIFLDNSDLFKEINTIFPMITDKIDTDLILNYLKYFYFKNDPNTNLIPINIEEFSNSLSHHFIDIKKEKLLNLPKSLLYSILTNPNLRIPSEDYLFDFIEELFSNQNNEEKIIFYETLELSNLSENKFNQFIDEFDHNEMTNTLWIKLKNCFYFQYLKRSKNSNKIRIIGNEKIRNFLFDKNIYHRFEGIIYNLSEGDPKHSVDKGIINITGSSNFDDNTNIRNKPKNVVDYENDDQHFFTKQLPNSWIMFDFIDKQVKPSHYSIK